MTIPWKLLKLFNKLYALITQNRRPMIMEGKNTFIMFQAIAQFIINSWESITWMRCSHRLIKNGQRNSRQQNDYRTKVVYCHTPANNILGIYSGSLLINRKVVCNRLLFFVDFRPFAVSTPDLISISMILESNGQNKTQTGPNINHF